MGNPFVIPNVECVKKTNSKLKHLKYFAIPQSKMVALNVNVSQRRAMAVKAMIVDLSNNL